MREIVEVQLQGHRLIGTLHRPDAPGADIGLLFFNAGHVPRDGHGGFWARLGDRLAAEGYPVYRFDFPGFGDSEGDLPPRIETFWKRVKRGDLAPMALALGDWVRETQGLDGVVMGGLCGAAIHSIFAAERRPEGIAGLLMLEPEFFLLEPDAGEEPQPSRELARWQQRATRLASGWSWLRVLTGNHPALRAFPGLRRTLLGLYTGLISLPERTNLELVRAWRRVLDLGMPSLVLTARDEMWDIYFRQVTRSVVGSQLPPNLEHHSVAGANHAFTRDDSMERAFSLILPWVKGHFPRLRSSSRRTALSRSDGEARLTLPPPPEEARFVSAPAVM